MPTDYNNPAGLLIIDVQGKLATMVRDAVALRQRIAALIMLCKLQNRPVIICEQMPHKLGSTHPLILEALSPSSVYEKHTFNAMMNSQIAELVKSHNYWAVAGIEAHICVYQTVLGMREAQLEVSVLADATSSRNQGDRQLGLAAMERSGAGLMSTEMLIYQWLGHADSVLFRKMLPVIKALPDFNEQ